MIWVVLWALGVVAFLVVFFRRARGLFLFWVLVLVLFIASVVVQAALMESAGYGGFVATAAHIGRGILIVAVTVLVASVVAMAIFTIRRGTSDDLHGKVITENRPLNISLGTRRPMGRSKRRMLGSKSAWISIESLLDGTATSAERIMVAGMITMYVSFFLVFVGVGLMLMQRLLFMVFVPVIPGLFLYRVARRARNEYRKARTKLRGNLRQASER